MFKDVRASDIICQKQYRSESTMDCRFQQNMRGEVIEDWHRGAGIAQWLERRTRDRKVAGSNPCWSGGRVFFSRVNFLC